MFCISLEVCKKILFRGNILERMKRLSKTTITVINKLDQGYDIYITAI